MYELTSQPEKINVDLDLSQTPTLYETKRARSIRKRSFKKETPRLSILDFLQKDMEVGKSIEDFCNQMTRKNQQQLT